MLKNNPIYFDNAATSLVNEEVLSFFNNIEKEYFANPNSVHQLGVISSSYLNKARNSILNSFHCPIHQVIFTSCATEANNLAIKGYCFAHKNRGNHIITTNIEHPSVLECFKQLEQFGFNVTILNVNHNGIIRLDDLRSALTNNTILVSIMAVNNEIGSINPISDIADLVHAYPKAVFHSDTTQAIGKMPLPYEKIDMFVVSSHKIHGIKGSGALIARKNISFIPILSGGGQEYGFRSGTESIALSASLAKAIKIANKDIDKKLSKMYEFNSYFASELAKIDGIVLNSNQNSSPYILNFSLLNKKASVVVEGLSSMHIYVSTVSACHSKKEKMSYVLKAIGKNDLIASNSIRLSFDNENTLIEVNEFIKALRYLLGSLK